MPGQTAIAGVVALGTCYGIVIIVEILRTGAPSRHHRPLRGIAGDALDCSFNTSETGVGAGQAELITFIVEVVISADAETGCAEFSEGGAVAGGAGCGTGAGLAVVEAARALSVYVEILVYTWAHVC